MATRSRKAAVHSAVVYKNCDTTSMEAFILVGVPCSLPLKRLGLVFDVFYLGNLD